jgi:dihydropteroate synthase-like protein
MVAGDAAGVKLLFVTGRLAEPALRRILEDVAPRAGFTFTVAVLPISVAALATTKWIAGHLTVPEGVERIILPGLCRGEVDELKAITPLPIERGPEDLRDLPEHFRTSAESRAGYGAYDLQIVAEINNAPRLPRDEFIRQARALRDDGADVIDVGCDPGGGWAGVGDAVRALRGEGMRVSIDSFDAEEVSAAVRAGAELVLSVNASNVERARDWGAEVVVVPDDLATLAGLDACVERLERDGVRYRLDPILEPIGLGFAPSLGRYLEVRRRYPDAAMMMGVGNVTELTDVDSAGVNVVLAGFCQEVGIRSVLTTQVINWARTSVKELDLARRLMHYAISRRVPPKRLEPALVVLRDVKLRGYGEAGLAELTRQIKDRNFRLFAEGGRLHAINGEMHVSGEDPFELFDAMAARGAIDPSHAFYLGYELAKAVTALTLGKNYTQDQALDWGFLTRAEKSHRG